MAERIGWIEGLHKPLRNKLSLLARRQAGTWNNNSITVQEVATLQHNAGETLASASGYNSSIAHAELVATAAATTVAASAATPAAAMAAAAAATTAAFLARPGFVDGQAAAFHVLAV